MENKRRIHDVEFNVKISLERLKSLGTMLQTAAENELHLTLVTQWESRMIEGASEVFEDSTGARQPRAGDRACASQQTSAPACRRFRERQLLLI
jgi:hypothetical protein